MRVANVVVSIFCAWVLWGQLNEVVPDTIEGNWEFVETYESKAQCSLEINQKDDTEIAFNSEDPKKRQVYVFSYVCLPDSVDPRAPKKQ
jgi:hypothetical protein